jgi:hypothetical protein
MRRFGTGVHDRERDDVWELNHLPDDFSQARNLVADHLAIPAELNAPGGGRRNATGCCPCWAACRSS